MAHESGPPAAVRVAPERQDPLLTSCAQWCVARGEVLETCSVVVILHFLQSVLDNRRAASTLRVIWPRSRPHTQGWITRR